MSNTSEQLLIASTMKKSEGVACVLNFFVPGVGYAYCGRVFLGIFVFLLVTVFSISTMGLLLPVFMIVCAIDGVLSVRRYNKQLIQRAIDGELIQ